MCGIDFVPKDHELCKKCVWYEQCPTSYMCKSWIRNEDYQEWNSDNLVRNGNSTKKVR